MSIPPCNSFTYIAASQPALADPGPLWTAVFIGVFLVCIVFATIIISVKPKNAGRPANKPAKKQQPSPTPTSPLPVPQHTNAPVPQKPPDFQPPVVTPPAAPFVGTPVVQVPAERPLETPPTLQQYTDTLAQYNPSADSRPPAPQYTDPAIPQRPLESQPPVAPPTLQQFTDTLAQYKPSEDSRPPAPSSPAPQYTPPPVPQKPPEYRPPAAPPPVPQYTGAPAPSNTPAYRPSAVPPPSPRYSIPSQQHLPPVFPVDSQGPPQKPTGLTGVIDTIGDGIENGFVAIGDGLVFVMDGIDRLFKWIFRTGKR